MVRVALWNLLLLVLCCCLAASHSFAAAFVKDYGSNVNEMVWNLKPTSDGGYIFSGHNGNLTIYPPVENGSLIKLDGMGAVEWQKIYVNDGRNWLTDVEETPDGGYIAALFRPTNTSAPSILRVDKNGNVLWCKSFTVGGVAAAGRYTTFAGHMVRDLVEKSSDNGYFVALNTSTLNPSYPDNRVWVLKLDDAGNILWQKLVSTRPTSAFHRCDDGGIILGANSGLVKLDAHGNIAWQKVYAGDSAALPRGLTMVSIEQTADGGFIAYANDPYTNLPVTVVLKLDDSGNIVWQKIFNISSSGAAWSNFKIFSLSNGSSLLGTYNWLMWLDRDGNILKVGNVENFHMLLTDENDETLTVRDFQNYPGTDFRITKIDSARNMPACAYYRDIQVSSSNLNLTAANGTFSALSTIGSSSDVAITAQSSTGVLQATVECMSAFPDIFLSSAFVDFGAVEYLHAESQTVLLANEGGAPLTIKSIALSGQSLNDFSYETDCTTVSPGDSCVVAISFTPSTLGSLTGVLTVISDDPDQSVIELPVTGTGVDTTPPVITLQGDAAITVEAGSNYSDAGAVALDIHDGVLTANLLVSSTVNTLIPGTYAVIYNVTDSSGNRAVEGARTVHVIDTLPPVITLNGAMTVMVEAGTAYVDAGAVADDVVDGDLTASISTINPVNVFVPGSYTLTYNVSDKAGNQAMVITRTVLVADTIPPTISLVLDHHLLWPPNHKMVDVLVAGTVGDNGSGVESVAITLLDEYGVYNKIIAGFGRTATLEAWREGDDQDGRIYTFRAVVMDKAGNASSVEAEVLVPHDMSKVH